MVYCSTVVSNETDNRRLLSIIKVELWRFTCNFSTVLRDNKHLDTMWAFGSFLLLFHYFYVIPILPISYVQTRCLNIFLSSLIRPCLSQAWWKYIYLWTLGNTDTRIFWTIFEPLCKYKFQIRRLKISTGWWL